MGGTENFVDACFLGCLLGWRIFLVLLAGVSFGGGVVFGGYELFEGEADG